MKKIFLFLSVILFYTQCKKDAENIITLSNSNTSITFKVPSNFSIPIAYKFENNIITEKKFQLGRKLFYDPILSGNNTISCASCHIQTSAFTHHGHSVSHGIHDLLGKRNSPAIQNVAWQKSFMWDGGVGDLDFFPAAPIENKVEMDETLSNVVKKLKAHSSYPQLFKEAFNENDISITQVFKSLSQFMLLLISANSKYDKVKRNEGESFTDAETKGYELFTNKCASCHPEPLFTTHSFANNGLSLNDVKDEGVFLVSSFESDKGKFKIPSLRNVALTAPYMHDGRYLTLDAAIEHYNSKIERHSNLDARLQSSTGSVGIALSTEEKALIKSFLNTLTDKDFITNKLFTQP